MFKQSIINCIERIPLCKKLFLKVHNKISINNNVFDVPVRAFKKNVISMNGDNHLLKCMEGSYLRNSVITVTGDRNVISVEKNTEINGGGACVFFMNGRENRIVIGENCKIRNTTFFISGDRNVIKINNNFSSYNVQFHMEQSDNEILIDRKTTMHGRDNQPVHLALDEGTKISIGEDCMFSNNIQMRTTDSHSIFNKEGKRINHGADIKIGRHCWIGMNAIILKGVHIADNSVVAAGSICIKKFEMQNSIVAGNPASIVKQQISWERKLF